MTSADLLDIGPSVLVAVMTCALAPLALRAVALPRLARVALPAGALAAASMGLRPGAAATGLVAPYAIACAVAGLVGVRRALARPWPPSQLAMHAGPVALAAAATWLVADRAGRALLGYPPLWVVLTAAHFHVAGAFLAVVIGWCAHERGRTAQAVALGCVLGLPLTAAGIAASPGVEMVGALVMAASGFGAAVLVLATTRGLLRVSGLPLAVGMVLAALYALRDRGAALSVGGLDPLTSMVASHGALETVFAALALAEIGRRPSRVIEAPPLSRLRGTWPVGEGFFARRGIERAPAAAPHGLVDDLADLGHVGLVAADVPPEIRAFYERTDDHAIKVRPRWRPGFRAGARVWAALARRMGQLQLPVHAESGREGITSRIVALAAEIDGRTAPRAWIRTFPDGRALYVAAYATHRARGRSYMNIAFPVPAGQLSSILRMDHHGRGVRVSTRLGGDCGVWLVVLGVPLRLPLSETVDVWTADDPDAPDDLRAWAGGHTVVARHDMWMFGVRYLALDYAMRPA